MRTDARKMTRTVRISITVRVLDPEAEVYPHVSTALRLMIDANDAAGGPDKIDLKGDGISASWRAQAHYEVARSA